MSTGTWQIARTLSLCTGTLIASMVVGAFAPHAEARDRYKVAYRTAVSGPVDLPDACDGRRAELFPQLVSHPGSPRRLTAVYFQDGQQAAVGARSRQGGRRWARDPVASAASCSGGRAEREALVNPLLAGGPAGASYYGNSWVGSRNGFLGFDVVVHRSMGPEAWSAGGAPNLASSPVLPGGPYAQNVGVVADRHDPNLVYAAWVEFDQVPNPATYAPAATRLVASVSSDGGQTFSVPVTVADPPVDTYVINARLYRTSDDALLAVYDTVPKAALADALAGLPAEFDAFSSRSTDGGETWSASVHAGDPVQFAFTESDGGDGRSYGSAKFDATTGPKGAAVVAWATPQVDGAATIEIARSADGGATWKEPSAAISVRAHVIQPATALDRQGRTGLFWYDTRKDEPGDGELTADAWFASSNSAGRRWQTRHLAGPFDLRASYDSEVVGYDGDQGIGVYQDLVSMRRGFGAAYTLGLPLAKDGVTDVEFARVVETPPVADR